MRLHLFASNREAKDVETETSISKDGLKTYWKENNQKSIDGLPGLLSAYDSPTKFVKSDEKWGQDDESIPSSCEVRVVRRLFSWTDVKLVLCFLLGWAACVIWTQFRLGMILQTPSPSTIRRIYNSL
jgi:hypothetical protein